MSEVKKIQIDGVSYDLGGGSGLSDDAKNALLNCLAHVAWIDEDGQQYVDALSDALFDNTWSVTNALTNATNSNPSATVEKDGIYSATISASAGYTLEGATVSVTMNGADITSSVYDDGDILIPAVTGDVVITVVAVALTVVSISAVYTQSGTVYADDSLDDLKADLVVTATYSDSTTIVVPSTDYTLSGSLTAGTSTITVTYNEETTTFSVTVTAPLYSIADFAEQTVSTGSGTLKISKTNNYFTMSGNSQSVVYVKTDGTLTTTRPTTLIFSTQVGQHLVNEIVDATWNNPTNTAISLDTKYCRTDNATNIYSASMSMPAHQSGVDGTAKYELEALSGARNISGLALQFVSNPSSSTASATFRVRLFIDGVRYL